MKTIKTTAVIVVTKIKTFFLFWQLLGISFTTFSIFNRTGLHTNTRSKIIVSIYSIKKLTNFVNTPKNTAICAVFFKNF